MYRFVDHDRNDCNSEFMRLVLRYMTTIECNFYWLDRNQQASIDIFIHLYKVSEILLLVSLDFLFFDLIHAFAEHASLNVSFKWKKLCQSYVFRLIRVRIGLVLKLFVYIIFDFIFQNFLSHIEIVSIYKFDRFWKNPKIGENPRELISVT